MRTRHGELGNYLYGGPYPHGYPAGLEKQLKWKL